MATLTFSTIKSLVRSDLNETGYTMLSETELGNIINDGYKDVTAKGLCNEVKISKSSIAAEKVISLIGTVGGGQDIIRVNYVERLATGVTTGGVGLIAVLPQTIGFLPMTTGVPQYWFQWGNYLVVEPVPTAATYDLNIYASCYPTAVMTAAISTLPSEFHECVYTFTLAFAALKLKRWADAANAYNKYIVDVQRKRAEYIMKHPDSRISHELPDSVTMEESKRG